ncbi:phosphotransferase family protein [Heliocybe sulcata]|uniref:Phosphotransferase family protein n=1 Tax=Heliocybe sulcata TaxID=5364 RepID=A0A5C3MYR8_9AGAM|nr:phosphotransferase family protein [Heliocybe sulcata]
MLRILARSHTVQNLSRRKSFCTFSTSTASNDDEQFYRYTSGRWIHDEPKQLALRYCRFNVDGLKHAAASACNAKGVTRMVKLAEGSYNKVFLLCLDNSKEVIARIKTPHAGPPHLVTASEVATMHFARKLGIPMPDILDWSSKAEQNPVEAEYIIMEKATGVELSTVWFQLSEAQRNRFVAKWITLEKALMARLSGGYGSLYYRSDVNSNQSRDLYVNDVREHEFVLGPSVERQFWTGERLDMELDRGPWDTPQAYSLAIANNAKQWLNNFAVRPAEFGIFDPPEHAQHPHLHLALLDQFAAVAPFLVPEDQGLTRPTLWPRDVHASNVFVSEGCLSGEAISITSVIDWQHLSVLPLYLQATVPVLFRYHGTRQLPAGDSEQLLSLPEDLDALDEEDRIQVRDDIEQFNRCLMYRRLCASLNPEYYRALALPTRTLRCFPVKFASNTWDDKFIPLRDILGRIYHNWDAICATDVPCPIHFTEEQSRTYPLEGIEWQSVVDARAELDRAVGVYSQDGWVPNEEYEGAVARNAQLMEMYIEDVMEGESADVVRRTWPYRPSSRS